MIEDRPAESELAKHQNALDGVRGLAIILVILFHSGYAWFGWIGVQIFFVLSGFLITSILLRDSDLPLGLYLKRFYWRRSLRIFPLYYGYVLVLGLVYVVTRAPETFRRDWPWLITYTLNFRHIFPDFASNPYYGRFWTLAVEEQFYLIWPLLIYLLPRRYFPAIVLTILTVEPILRGITPYFLAPILHNTIRPGAAIYYLTPCQMDSFALGAGVLLLGRRFRRHSVMIFICCTVVLLACGQMKALISTGRLALFNSGYGYDLGMMQAGSHIWGYTLINVWAGALILASSGRNWISTVLAHPWLTYIGKISYGMYVYHQIIQYAGFRTLGNLFHTRHGFICYFFCVLMPPV